MMTVNDTTVRHVVEEVLAQLAAAGTVAAGRAHQAAGSLGAYRSVDDAVAAAGAAFIKFQRCTIQQRRLLTDRIRRIVIDQADTLGRQELEETKIGRLDHKIEKLKVCGEKSLGVECLRTEAGSGDRGITLTEFAPFGVIAAITPVTHSLPTLANNAISMLSAGNTVVFNAHPSGANIAKTGVRLINESLRQLVGIEDLITIVDPPTIETAQRLFEHRDVRLLVVTGGPAVARAALASRKRAIVAGPGNPPVVVDETACLNNAAASIIKGAAFDNNLLCIGEKEVFAVHAVFAKLMDAMSGHGAFRLSEQQVRDLERAAFVPGDGGKTMLNKDLVGKDPHVLAQAIGLRLPTDVELLFGETGETSPFVDHEQMMPFVPFIRVDDVDTAISLAKKYEHGFKHTAVIHSRNLDAITRMGRELDTTIFVANGPSTGGLGVGGEGTMSFSIATPTGEGILSPLSFTRQRRLTVVDSLRVL